VYKRAIEIEENNFGPDHADLACCLAWLADLQIKQGQFDPAELLIKRCLMIYEKNFGLKDSRVAWCLDKLASICQKTGREKEAGELANRAQAIRGFTQ
jgi:hypothetical protein